MTEAEKMLNQIVLVNEEVLGGWNFSPQGFVAQVDKQAKLLEHNAAQIVAKVRECMAIATSKCKINCYHQCVKKLLLNISLLCNQVFWIPKARLF
jgi:hypothetical protein